MTVDFANGRGRITSQPNFWTYKDLRPEHQRVKKLQTERKPKTAPMRIFDRETGFVYRDNVHMAKNLGITPRRATEITRYGPGARLIRIPHDVESDPVALELFLTAGRITKTVKEIE